MATVTASPAATTAGRGAHHASRSAAAGFLLALPPVVVIALFVGVPVVLALAFSVGFTGGLNSVVAAVGQNVHHADGAVPTFAAYGDVFTTPAFWQDLALTLGVTLASTAIVVVLAGGIGLALRLHGGRLARLLSAVAIVPLFIPVVIASWAILTFYSADGFLRSLFAQVGLEAPVWSYTAVAIVIGSAWTSLPFATLMIASGLQSVPDALIEAARDAGAGTARIVRTILLPMSAVPIVIAVTFTAIGVIGSYTVPYFTGPNAPTMLGVSLASYFTAYNQPQQSLVMAFVVFLAAAGIGALYVWANFRSARREGRI
ncbi:ABC transporter permease [Leifsonia sp. TF02-11]|uniref:ABC transporter permease n=1 Tax=Leifsonia sp. TF02-11 TaxID=2815212 RepID=UPI001AA1A56E|nr:ABC transporter permease subunit [Leifsonia sp. TF02-11]MBN9630131.1 ABC transporter permease subunit [Actinomycetota bacterium]MBO1739447.1 ABC transporter permease subunit [Leifsonia sp. TF02-11]